MSKKAKKVLSPYISLLCSSGENRKVFGSLGYLPYLNKYEGCKWMDEIRKKLLYDLVKTKKFKTSCVSEFKNIPGDIPFDIVKEKIDGAFTTTQVNQRVNGFMSTIKRFGLCDLENNEVIRFSNVGKKLLELYNKFISENTSEEDKENARINIIKYLRNTMAKVVQEEQYFIEKEREIKGEIKIREILNNKVIIPFLLGVMKKVGNVIGRRDIIIISLWPNNNLIACAEAILQLRKDKQQYTMDGCFQYMIDFIGIPEMRILKKNTTREETINNIADAIMNNWANFLEEVYWVKKENGHLVLNECEMDSINYVISKYLNFADCIESYEEYRELLGEIDEVLMIKPYTSLTKLEKFYNQCDKWTFEEVILELKRLNGDKSIERNSKLPNNMMDCVVLEFVVSISLRFLLKKANIVPNFNILDNGLPERFAQGNRTDIEVKDYERDMNVEVTLIGDSDSLMQKEFVPITRHINKKGREQKDNKEPIFCLFIAKSLPEEFMGSVKGRNKTMPNKIIAVTLNEYIEYLSEVNNYYKTHMYGRIYSTSDIYNDLGTESIIDFDLVSGL